MCQVTPPLVTLIAVYALSSVGQPTKYYTTLPLLYTRNVTLKQGVLRGMVVHPKINRKLPLVEVYRGIPYAAPPVGKMRFMPTGSAPSWTGVRDAFSFGPVCPQIFPNETAMSAERKNYFKRLKQYLMYHDEDCLHLNIYAPYQEDEGPSMKYPIIVFIHGESFEWNSGNPYDGSVLAAYGNVIVVTLNFRLGIFGFLRADRGEAGSLSANFGLVDVVAALDWLQENAGAFGGDAGAVTLAGHGTGAAVTALLMISPLVERRGGDERLFHRAILMSGTSLADWAMAETSKEVAYQVAKGLNCQLEDDYADCLRKKRMKDILLTDAYAPPYKTRFGPVVDGVLVPGDPRKSMTTYTDMFRKFELLYGVTEQEGQHLIDDITLQVGLLEKDRDQEILKYVRTKCEKRPDLCLQQTLLQYNYTNQTNKEDYDPSSDQPAIIARDQLMDILSDSRTAAPVLETGIYHSDLNIQSYFYIFSHKTFSKEHIRNKSYNGEELPYLFGVPLDGPKFHFVDSYTDQEKLLSEVIMTYFCNFAYTGNPNMPRKNEYLTLNAFNWKSYDVEWPEFNKYDQRYIKLDTPPSVGEFYRKKQMKYWNEDFSNVAENYSKFPQSAFTPNRKGSDNPLPWVIYGQTPKPITIGIPGVFVKPSSEDEYRRVNETEIVYGTVITSPSQELRNSSHTMNILMIVGGVFLLANLFLFLALYLRCMKKKMTNLNKDDIPDDIEDGKAFPCDNGTLPNGCSFVRMLSKSSRSDDIYDPVAGETPNFKLSRQMSNSTIDAHTKVRDWITSGIIEKYSPRYFRRNRMAARSKLQVCGYPSESTLGRSPTRPVSPTDDVLLQNKLVKTASIDRRRPRPPVEKISVAIDATPSGRGPSVLRQQPIEFTKSLDVPSETTTPTPLRRSVTLEDFSPRKLDKNKELRKSSTSINLKYNPEPIVIKIQHGYSKSEPVQDLNYATMRKLKTFDPTIDVNVTSRDENEPTTPLTPEEALMTIKRRNFPKVLPDYPSKESLMHKRRSMPAHNLFQPIPEGNSLSQSSSPTNQSLHRLPPTPPPRTSTLTKQLSSPQPVCISEPTLAEDLQMGTEPEVACNLLYVGPLIPKIKGSQDKLKNSCDSLKIGKEETKNLCDSVMSLNNRNEDALDICPVYDTLRYTKDEPKVRSLPRTIVTADPNAPIKRNDPKVVVKPTIAKIKADDKLQKNIPRVVVPDNQPQIFHTDKLKFLDTTEETQEKETNKEKPSIDKPKPKKSQIPTLIKNSNSSLNKDSNESSPSSSSPSSEESDTGTVVKRIK